MQITEKEAWSIFRLAAISEAFSWLLLLIGIYFKYVVKPGTGNVVAVGGSIHGIVFLAYAAALLLLWRVLQLSLWQLFVAAIASIVPFGTLAFEQWLAHRRERTSLNSYRQVKVWALIFNKEQLLAVQTNDTACWSLLGGEVQGKESVQQALQRRVQSQIGILPEPKELRYMLQSDNCLELFFTVSNNQEYLNVNFDVIRQGFPEIEEINFITPRTTEDLQPKFLQHVTPLAEHGTAPAVLIS